MKQLINYLTFYAALVCLCTVHPVNAWETANDAGPGVVGVIGQSFRPSVIGEGDSFTLPRAANGLAFLESFEFDIDGSESYPDEIYLYASPPSVVFGVVSGDGAFAVGQREFNTYYFDPPVALPYDTLTYVVFPTCVLAPATLGSYSGGQNLIPQGGCPANASVRQIVSGGFDLDFSARFLNPEASLLADYRFDQKDLSSFKAGAPNLLDLGSNQTISDNVLGQNREVLNVVSGTGLQLDLKNQLSQEGYSLVMLLRVDQTDEARKLIDLSDLTQDTGMYVQEKAVVFRGDPGPSGNPPAVIDENTYVQVTLVRQQPTMFSTRSAQGFVDDQSVFGFVDNAGVALPTEGVAALLRDEAGENTGGAIARVRLFDGELRSSEVRTLEPLPPSTTDLYESDNTPFEADIGLESGRFASYRTLHSSADIDWIYVGDECYSNNYYSTQGGLHLYSDDPRFQPIIEVYGDGYLTDISAPPEAVYGACGQSNNVQFDPGAGHFSIRNCASVDLSAGPVFYTVVPLVPDLQVCGPVATIQGSVIDADTSQPVGGQFILGNSTNTAVSNPAGGAYSLAVIAGVMNLEVVSPQWEGAPVQVVTEAGENYTGVDILVTRIAPPDDMPIAVKDNFSGPEDVALTGDLAANDTLSTDGGNVFSLATDATQGTASVTAVGEFNYDPDLNSNGPDSFSYRITDVDGDVDIADVSIIINPVNDTPVAVDDTLSIDEGSPPQNIDVLINDSDVENGPLTISAVTQPSGGVVIIAGNEQTLSYAPAAGFCNNGSPPDTFTYTLSDGADTAQAEVSVSVTCTSDRVFADGFEP